MKLSFENYFLLKNYKNISIWDIRKQLLSWMLVLLNLFVLPIIIIGTLEAFHLQQVYAAVFYLLFYFPILFTLLFRRWLPYWLTVIIFLASGYIIGVVNIVLYGFSGAGIPIFCTLAVLATILFGIREGILTILLSSLPMIVVGYFMTTERLALDIDLMQISKNPVSWLTAVVTMMFLSGIMIFGYGIIQKNLLHTLKYVRQQAFHLKQANKKQAEDLLYRKKMQEELEYTKNKAEESNKLKTEFINNLSHEIRTPLNSIIGFSHFLEHQGQAETDRMQYLRIIQRSGNQLLHIIDDLLEISRLETRQVPLEIRSLCLNTLLDERFAVFKAQADDKGLDFRLSKSNASEQTCIKADEAKLIRILNCLLNNAIKFTHTGYVRLGYHILPYEHPPLIELFVEDTGVGIKKEMQEKVFERFQQEEKELSKNVGGLGLGLSIALENAELLDGTITIKSEKGKGSVFYLHIPYNPDNKNN